MLFYFLPNTLIWTQIDGQHKPKIGVNGHTYEQISSHMDNFKPKSKICMNTSFWGFRSSILDLDPRLLQLLTAFRYQMVPEKINFNLFMAAIPETKTTEDPKNEIRVSPNVGKVLMNRGSPHPVFPALNIIEQKIIWTLPSHFWMVKNPGHGFLATYLIPGCVRTGVKVGSENLFHRRQRLDFQN